MQVHIGAHQRHTFICASISKHQFWIEKETTSENERETCVIHSAWCKTEAILTGWRAHMCIAHRMYCTAPCICRAPKKSISCTFIEIVMLTKWQLLAAVSGIFTRISFFFPFFSQSFEPIHTCIMHSTRPITAKLIWLFSMLFYPHNTWAEKYIYFFVDMLYTLNSTSDSALCLRAQKIVTNRHRILLHKVYNKSQCKH